MRSFWKIVFGSCLGVILAGIILTLIGGGIVGGLVANMNPLKKEDTKIVTANSILKLDLNAATPEHTGNIKADVMSGNLNDKALGIHDICELIKKAKTDNKIKGIYVNLQSAQINRAMSQQLQDALEDFKSDGKFIYAYADNYSSNAYYLATAADEIAMHPVGQLDLRGFGVVMAYFKNMMTKLGLSFDIYYAGKFKSATEPFRSTEMSEANRKQVKRYLETMYHNYLDDIAENRNMTRAAVESALDRNSGLFAQSAKSAGLIDLCVNEGEIFDMMRERLDYKEDEKLKFVDLDEYSTSVGNDLDLSIKDKIAVVYAEGGINDNDEQYGSVSGDAYVKMLRKIKHDDKVKGVVMRVNSPGGSVMASEKIWYELKEIQKKGKPVIASMAGVAASGGYYISSASDSIFVEENTITGSIGVFFMIPKVHKLMKEKLGIDFDTLSTNDLAVQFNPFIKANAEEKQAFQAKVDTIYDLFLKRVADNRKMSKEQVHEVAQGRVWVGQDAIDRNLADRMGNLDDAISSTASMAGLESYRVTEYPRIKEPYQQLIEKYLGKGFNTLSKIEILERMNNLNAEDLVKEYKNQVIKATKPQARLPLFIEPVLD